MSRRHDIYLIFRSEGRAFKERPFTLVRRTISRFGKVERDRTLSTAEAVEPLRERIPEGFESRPMEPNPSPIVSLIEWWEAPPKTQT